MVASKGAAMTTMAGEVVLGIVAARQEPIGPVEAREILAWRRRHGGGWQAAAQYAGRPVHDVRMACDGDYAAAFGRGAASELLVALRRQTPPVTRREDPPPTPSKRTPIDESLLALMVEGALYTASSLARAMCCGQYTAVSALERLEADGRVRREMTRRKSGREIAFFERVTGDKA